MKTISYYTICMAIIFFNAQAMDNSTINKKVCLSPIQKVSVGASICTLIGGWGFFVVNSPRFMNTLSYSTKRAPLALFLAGCSINQGFNISKNIKNE